MIRYSVETAQEQRGIEAEPFHQYVFDNGTVWTEFYRIAGHYLLGFPGLADFEISVDGEWVKGYPAVETDEPTLEHLYINQLVPLALSRQGRPTFHASVVTVESGAVAFLGKTGAGKSTLAASFALDEAAFLTDDALLIEETDSGCLALPSHASLRLWEDSVDELLGDRGLRASEITYSTKARLLAGEGLAHRGTPQRLLAAFLLEGQATSDINIRPLAGSERHMAWLSNSFLLDVEDRALLAQHFDWTHRIAEAIPTLALEYPRDYGMLPRVRDAVRTCVAGL